MVKYVICHRAIAYGEALPTAHPEHLEIVNNIEVTLANLGLLLEDAGHGTEMEAACHRIVTLRESLYAANPDNVEIKVGYAASLGAVGQYAEAERLVDAVVLTLMPEHPYANQLRHDIRQEMPLPPDTTKVTLASVAHPRANPAKAA